MLKYSYKCKILPNLKYWRYKPKLVEEQCSLVPFSMLNNTFKLLTSYLEDINYSLTRNACAHHLFGFRAKPKEKYYQYLNKSVQGPTASMRDSGYGNPSIWHWEPIRDCLELEWWFNAGERSSSDSNYSVPTSPGFSLDWKPNCKESVQKIMSIKCLWEH